jgi:hypothetical protein
LYPLNGRPVLPSTPYVLADAEFAIPAMPTSDHLER